MPRLAQPSSYNRLRDRRVSPSVFIDVLQMTQQEKTDVTPLIISKLESKGIVLTDTCGSDCKKAAINEIIRALKAEPNHRALFNRAKNADEDVEEVDKAPKSTKKTAGQS